MYEHSMYNWIVGIQGERNKQRLACRSPVLKKQTKDESKGTAKLGNSPLEVINNILKDDTSAVYRKKIHSFLSR